MLPSRGWRLQRMSEEDRERLFGKVYPDRTVIFRENEPGEDMYIIQDGVVEISSTVNGEKMVWGELSKGSFFGEMALFDDKPRSATATVKGSARLMVLNRNTVKDRLKGDPHIGVSRLR